MKYISVTDFAQKHGISERTVRNYCASGKIDGVFLIGKTWNIPEDAEPPKRYGRRNKRYHAINDGQFVMDIPLSDKGHVFPLLATLREQKEIKLKGSIYHRTQIDMTYNSNHIEGSRLTHDQTRFIFETNTIGISDEIIDVDDIVETVNHFHCIDYIIDHAEDRLTEELIKQIHLILKMGTSVSRKDWFAVGDYKRLPNEIGGRDTCPPNEVPKKMKLLLSDYNAIMNKTLIDILDFHVCFENIHPFQDGNGRVGRLLMFKECLANGIIPFIITDELKLFYYRGLSEWGHINGYLTDTCLTAQDQYKALLDKFGINLF